MNSIYRTDFNKKNFTEKQRKDLATAKMSFYRTALEDSELTSTAVRILGLLLLKYYNNKTGQCNPAETTLAADVKKDESTVRRCISQLEAHGYITIQHGTNVHGANKSNQYRFKWVPLKNERRSKMSGHPLKIARGTAHCCTKIPLKNEHLTTEGTTQRTNQKNTHGVCDSDSPLHERNKKIIPKEDSNSTSEDSSHGNSMGNMKSLAFGSGLVQENGHEFVDSTSSSKESIPSDQEYDDDLAAFASLAESYDPPLSPMERKRSSESRFRAPADNSADIDADISPKDDPSLCPVRGITVPRGKLTWITDAGKLPLKKWLVSKGLKRKYVESLRYVELMACYNDATDETIKTHSYQQYGMVPPVGTNEPSPPIVKNEPSANEVAAKELYDSLPDPSEFLDPSELRDLRSRKTELEQLFDDELKKYEGW